MPSPDRTVLRWRAVQNRESVSTTAITQAETLYGVEILPPGKRLPFDREAATVYAKIVSACDNVGRPISQFNAVIASVCRARNAVIATRNVPDCEHCGLTIIIPWNA